MWIKGSNYKWSDAVSFLTHSQENFHFKSRSWRPCVYPQVAIHIWLKTASSLYVDKVRAAWEQLSLHTCNSGDKCLCGVKLYFLNNLLAYFYISKIHILLFCQHEVIKIIAKHGHTKLSPLPPSECFLKMCGDLQNIGCLGFGKSPLFFPSSLTWYIIPAPWILKYYKCFQNNISYEKTSQISHLISFSLNSHPQSFCICIFLKLELLYPCSCHKLPIQYTATENLKRVPGILRDT